MNTEALLQLIRVMEEVRDDSVMSHRFNLGSWYNGHVPCDITDKGDFKHKVAACGTSCCAAGYAGLDKWFRSRGFFGINHSVMFRVYDSFDHFGMGALMRFFELPDNEIRTIFYNDGYQIGHNVTPDDVIVNINKVINRNAIHGENK